MSTQEQAFEVLRTWARENGMAESAVDASTGKATEIKGSWVLTPPGYSNMIFAVRGQQVRSVQPGLGRLQEALAALGEH